MCFLIPSSRRRTSRRHRRPVKSITVSEDIEKREGEDEEEEEEEERGENKQQGEKSRVDDLWESFKQDSAAGLRKPEQVKNSDQTPSNTSKARCTTVHHSLTHSLAVHVLLWVAACLALLPLIMVF